MTKLSELKYLHKSGKGWLFDPPQEAIDAGVVARKYYRDGRIARGEVPELVKRVEQWRKGEIPSLVLSVDSTLKQLVAHYLSTPHFNSLAQSSQGAYRVGFKVILNTSLGTKKVGDIRLRDLDGQLCHKIYEQWTNYSDNIHRIFGVLMSHAISLDLLFHNPMAKVKKVKKEKRSVIWTRPQVEKFLDVAFSDFRYRNVGLICLMAYEWMQRPTDMRLLKWESVHLDENFVQFKQTKRGAEVTLPIPENLQEMLEQQHQDFGFQEWVVPHLRASDNAWRPYDRQQLSRLANEVLDKADLPMHLRLGDLRKTGITEAIEADVPITNLMAVTGHKSLTSLSPYVKHTLNSATTALNKRKENR